MNADADFTIQSNVGNGDGTSTVTTRDENPSRTRSARYFRIRVN
ncbi:MAG: hypothetical protein OSB05_11355 [Akkermansiaceae bacterium]|nr:hypothetical protein [Akkermansiaceae bacterium]